MSHDIEIRTSIWKTVPLIGISWLFVAAAIYFWEPGSKFIGVVTFIFFGGGSLVALYQVLDRRPRLILSERGVMDRTMRIGTIDWDDVISSRLISIFGTKFIALRLKNPNKYLKRRKGKRLEGELNRTLGFGEQNIFLGVLDMKPEKIFSIVEKRISENRRHEH